MEQTKTLPPLVSDEYLSSHTPISQDWKDGPRTPVTPTEVRDIYEAERSKLLDKITRLEGTTNFETVPKEQYDRTREVVQALVDALGELRYGAELGAIEWDCQCEEDAGITCGPCGSFERGDAALALAKSINIEPTKP